MYFPAIFDQLDLQNARAVILTPEVGLTTDDRWERETAFLRPFLSRLPPGLVIDYGCGIGRLSRLLIDDGHPVVGIDISPTMLGHAGEQIGLDRLAVAHPSFLNGQSFQAQSAIAVWSLQHCVDVLDCIDAIAGCLAKDAPFLVINRDKRYLPARHHITGRIGFVEDDAIDVHSAIRSLFSVEYEEEMPAELCESGAWLRIYRKR